MKKLFSSLSALAISLLLTANAFAADLGIDNINVNSDNITFSVVLSELPNEINALHGLQIRYTYDADVLEYKSGMSTLLDRGGLEMTVKDGKGNVVWLDMNVADDVNSKKVTAKMLEEANRVLFELQFTRIDGAAEETSIIIDYARITESIGGGKFTTVTAEDLTISDGIIRFSPFDDDVADEDEYEPIVVLPEETYDDAEAKVIIIKNIPAERIVTVGGKQAVMLTNPDGSADYYVAIDIESDYSDIVIEKCESGETPAKLIMGDADLNGEITPEDIIIILKKAAELDEVSKYYENPFAYVVSDIIGDGHITSSDAFVGLGILGNNPNAYKWIKPIGMKLIKNILGE